MAIVLNKIILGHGMIVTFIIIFHVLKHHIISKTL